MTVEVRDGTLSQVTEQPARLNSAAAVEAAPEIELYMIRTPRYRPALFVPRQALNMCATTDSDRVRKFIRRMMRNRYAIIRWVGRVTRLGHHYYQRLEDRIDPLERMIKALNCPRSVQVRHAPRPDPGSEFRDLLRGQVVKHSAWLVVDGALTTVAVMFFWVLVPIPGPNIFFYYPALRLASHYRAMTGARRALNDIKIVFEAIPELGRLEADLRSPTRDVGVDAVLEMNIEGLDLFLRRMV